MFLHCVSCINCLALAITQTLDTKMFYCKDKDEAKVINYTELWPLPNEWPLLPWRSIVNQSIPCFTVGCQHLSSKPISSHTLIFDMLYIYYFLFCRSLLSKITCFSHIVEHLLNTHLAQIAACLCFLCVKLKGPCKLSCHASKTFSHIYYLQ